jgi:phospholipase D1/2
MVSDVRQPILQPGLSCWRMVVADRFALLPDGESYMPAMRAAVEAACQSILLIGWDFDPRIPLNPAAVSGAQDRLCDLFSRLLARRPHLRIQVLIWDMSLLFAWQRRERYFISMQLA